jgi:hypothetical protein
MVWGSLLKEPLEVVYRCSCRAPAATHGGRDAPHAGAARFLATVLITASYGRGPSRVLLVPLVTSSDALLGAVRGIIDGASLSLLGVTSLLAYVGRCMASL